MRPLRALLVYLVLVFAGAALLAPPLWMFAQWAAEQVPALQNIAANPFHRYVNRGLLLLALAGLWPLCKALGMRRPADFGWAPWLPNARRFGLGFAAGFGSLALAAAVVVLTGGRDWATAHGSGAIVKHLVNATLAAVLVGVLEELLFRGAVFGGLRRAHSLAVAVLISSGIYALVHFFDRPPPPPEISWLTGFSTLAMMARGFADWNTLVPAFLNLFLAGAVLAVAFERTGNLHFSIGLHAGWIFWLKSFQFFTRAPATDAGVAKLIESWAVFPLLALLLLAVLKWNPRR